MNEVTAGLVGAFGGSALGALSGWFVVWRDRRAGQKQGERAAVEAAAWEIAGVAGAVCVQAVGMQQGLRRAKDEVEWSDRLGPWLATEARTIHRALGFIRARSDQFPSTLTAVEALCEHTTTATDHATRVSDSAFDSTDWNAHIKALDGLVSDLRAAVMAECQ